MARAAAQHAGHSHLILDRTLIPIDWVADDRPFYSGKHHKHGMNLQVIASPAGGVLWVCGPLPGGRERPDRRPDLGHHVRAGHVNPSPVPDSSLNKEPMTSSAEDQGLKIVPAD